MSRFLSFVVEETLSGGAEAVKEVTVAMAVFDRPVDFNPKIDPVVRNEARRLRGKLEAYYAAEGQSDRIRISIPKGHYTPLFEAMEAPAAIVPEVVEPPAPPPPVTGPPKRKPAVWLTTIVIVASLAGLGGVLLHRPVAVSHSAVTVTPITSQMGEDFDPAISPDGQNVAFAREGADGNVDIYVQSLSGDARRLTTHPDNDLHPSWSPDGKSIAFLRAGPETSRVMVIAAAGGPEKQIVVPGRFDPGHTRVKAGPLERIASAGPAWSPDGKSLLFRQCLPRRENGCPLHVVSLATLQVKRLTEQMTGTTDVLPAWSPDGRQVAFARVPGYTGADIYVIPAEGGATKRLTNEARDIRGLAWSSDGQHLVFSSNRSGTYSLWNLSLSDGSIQPINAIGETAIQPAVAAGDQMLVYTDATMNVNIWRFDVEKHTTEKMIASTRQNRNGVWSTDGRRFAFTSDRKGGWDQWVANIDGSQATQLTHFAGNDFGRSNWSPDGKLLAFEALTEGRSEIFVTAPGEGTPRRLLPEPTDQRSPSWSRDGRWIYFISNRGGKFQIWKSPAAGGTAELVCDAMATDVAESPDGQSLIYFAAPDKGFWRMPLPSGTPHLIPHLEDAHARRWWALNDRGIWFYDETPDEVGLFFYAFETQTVSLVTKLDDRGLPVSTPSFSISPDGRYLTFSKIDTSHSQLMAIHGAFLGQ